MMYIHPGDIEALRQIPWNLLGLQRLRRHIKRWELKAYYLTEKFLNIYLRYLAYMKYVVMGEKSSKKSKDINLFLFLTSSFGQTIMYD